MRRGAQADDPFRVLFLCTGNLCRSPFAERLGRAYLEQLLGDDASVIELSSAGTRAVEGSAMHPDSSLVLSGFGGDPSGFVARQLTDAVAADADLVLAMTRRHREAVLQRVPRALNRTFTLVEAADLLREDLGIEGRTPRERVESLLRGMAQRRARRSTGPADDIPDPIGRPVEVHAEVGQRITDALLVVLPRVAEALVPADTDGPT